MSAFSLPQLGKCPGCREIHPPPHPRGYTGDGKITRWAPAPHRGSRHSTHRAHLPPESSPNTHPSEQNSAGDPLGAALQDVRSAPFPALAV